jgi:two-component system, NarL family, capsular synthesis sensor histidine kinase RcsC
MAELAEQRSRQSQDGLNGSIEQPAWPDRFRRNRSPGTMNITTSATRDRRRHADPSTVPDTTELGLLNRYQRALLYGGGIVLTLVISAATLHGLWSSCREYIADQRASFLTTRSLLSVALEAQQTMFTRTVASAELLWAESWRGTSGLIENFSASGGREVIQRTGRAAPQFAFAQITPETPASAYAHYLTLTARMGNVMSAAGRQLGAPVSGMFYSPGKTFASIYPPERAALLASLFGSSDVSEWIDRLAPGAMPFIDAPRFLARRSADWLPPDTDPLTGNAVLRLVQPALFEGAPFAIFMRDVPADVVRATLKERHAPGELMVIDESGRVILHSAGAATVADTKLAERALAAGSWRRGMAGLNDSYRHGLFTVSDRVPGTGWVLAYFWSWRTLAAALAPEWTVRGGSTLGILAVLWVFLLLFDKKVFRPVYRRSQRVFESESLNRTIVSLAPFGVGLFAARDGAVLLENEAMRHYRELGGRELRQQAVEQYRRLQRDYREAGETAPREYECSVSLPNGVTWDLAATMVATRYEATSAVLCVATNITERKQIERAALEAREAADTANRMKSVFLASMSHEMRTPLNAIIGHLELIQREDAQAQGANRERLRIASASAQGLLSLINDILDVSKAESGSMTLESIAFDIRRILNEVVDLLEPLANAKGLAFETQYAGLEHGCYRGDPTRVRQILINLAGNAIKFTESGSVSIRAEETCVDGGTMLVTLAVHDTGIGIAAATQHDIFDIFRQSDSTITRRFGGTGLGLALCKRLVDLMEGDITVESELGEGSTFTVALPLARDEADAVSLSPSNEATHAVTGKNKPLHVLAVDDHPFNRSLIADQLRALGHTFDVVADALAALRQYLQHRYDVVLTDLQMPGMDGCALAMCLRDHRPDLPVIAFTAASSEEDLARCERAGMSATLQKPVTLAALDAAIRDAARQHGTAVRERDGAISSHAASALTAERHTILAVASERSLAISAQAIAERDIAVLCAEIHATKGAFAMIEAHNVTQQCAEIESCARDGRFETLGALLERLAAAVRDTLQRRAPMGPCEPGVQCVDEDGTMGLKAGNPAGLA